MFKTYFRKRILIVLRDIKFESFFCKSINAPNHAQRRGKDCLSCTVNQEDIIKCLMTMKTTISTGKIQKFNRKVRGESVEAIQTISFSLETLSMIH